MHDTLLTHRRPGVWRPWASPQVMATRCTAIVSDDQDEGEVYRLFKPQRYVEGAEADAAEALAVLAEMREVLCKADCAVGSGSSGGKKGKKGKKKKDKKKKKKKASKKAGKSEL
jgi:prophage tail gpP-like protein